MKAFLLAAGEGTRLKPLTNHVPKCLVPIGGRPLLGIWFERLAQHGVGEVLVNTHHLASNVWDFAERWTGPPKIRLTFEPELLGSAGTLRWNRDFVAGEEDFLVCYADNLTDIDIGRLVGFHRSRHALITMALFRSSRPAECGIVELDDAGRVTGYEEKPPDPKSCLANGGFYVMHAGIFPKLPSKTVSDIGYDLLPQCLGEMYGLEWDGLLIDVGTPAGYALAQEAWTRRRAAAV